MAEDPASGVPRELSYADRVRRWTDLVVETGSSQESLSQVAEEADRTVAVLRGEVSRLEAEKSDLVKAALRSQVEFEGELAELRRQLAEATSVSAETTVAEDDVAADEAYRRNYHEKDGELSVGHRGGMLEVIRMFRAREAKLRAASKIVGVQGKKSWAKSTRSPDEAVVLFDATFPGALLPVVRVWIRNRGIDVLALDPVWALNDLALECGRGRSQTLSGVEEAGAPAGAAEGQDADPLTSRQAGAQICGDGDALLEEKDRIVEEREKLVTSLRDQLAETDGLLFRDRAFLAHACELLATADREGKSSDGDTAVELLLRMSVHEAPVVREGAVCGLEGRLGEPEVVGRLRLMADHDPSEGVREAAAEAVGEATRELDRMTSELDRMTSEGGLPGEEGP